MMTFQERLDGICRMLDEQRREDGGEDWGMVWSTQPGVGGHSYAMAMVDLTYQGQHGDHIVLIWSTRGLIEASVRLKEPSSGAITKMTVLAAEHPQGDFQVSEALEALV